MPTIIQEFSAPFVYSIHFTRGAFDPSNFVLSELLAPVVSGGNRVFFVVDAELARVDPRINERIVAYCHAHGIEKGERPVSLMCIPGGESVKGDHGVMRSLAEHLHREGISRHSVVVALGGGAVLDVVGCVAAVMLCGIRVVCLPTTVVAQSCVGHSLKHTVHLGRTPNALGVFSVPLAVINDAEFLATLPQAEYLSGMSEVLKVAASRDAELFQQLEKSVFEIETRGEAALRQILERTVGIHSHHIGRNGDPFEHGSRRPLEFGYWLAHRLFTIASDMLRYGEALLVAMQIDAMYAHISETLPESELQRIVWLCGRFGGAAARPIARRLLPDGEVESALADFQRRSGGQLQLPYLSRLGEVTAVSSVDYERVRESVEIVSNLAGD